MHRVRSQMSDPDVPGGSWAGSLFTAPLANVGLVPSHENPRGCGVFFAGDGEASEGWYHAWSLDRDLVVASCDFRLLKRVPFAFDFTNYFAIRHESAGIFPPAQAMAFLETRPRTGRVVMPTGTHVAYTEIEYYDGYFEKAFGSGCSESLAHLSACLGAMRGEGMWDPQIPRLLEAIGGTEAHGRAAELLFAGIANEVMGRMLAMEDRFSEAVDDGDRRAIVLVADHIRANIDAPPRLGELADMAQMGTTKFKRLFRQLTGTTTTEFIAIERVEQAKQLLASSELSIGQIARMCGFARATSFSALFSKRVGTPPRTFRKLARVAFSDDPVRAVELR